MCPAGEAGSGMDMGAFVHLYARQFVHTDVQLALEYYFAAARLQVSVYVCCHVSIVLPHQRDCHVSIVMSPVAQTAADIKPQYENSLGSLQHCLLMHASLIESLSISLYFLLPISSSNLLTIDDM